MDAEQSQTKYLHADHLFKSGRYQEALSLLNELNQAFPNAQNVLYPAALCLERLGRNREALAICERLIHEFQDARAQEIRARLVPTQLHVLGVDEELANLGLTGASDLLDLDAPRGVPAYKPVEPDREWKKYVLIGLGVAVLLAILIIPPLVYEAPPDAPAARPTTLSRENFVQVIGIGSFLFITAASMLGYIGGGYFALALQHRLPSDDISGNLISIGGIVLVTTLLGFVPIVGPIIGLVIIARTYDLGCGGLIVFCILAGIGSLITALIPAMVIISSMGMIPAN